MDPLSQGLLGASLAQSAAKRKQIRAAAICGAIGGMAPDLDIFIRSQTDPLLAIEYHRHFTHALPFVPIGGLLVAIVLWLVMMRGRSSLSFAYVYLFTTLGFATHGLLDACTGYGTRLFWPLSNLRVSWNVVSIIDPLFTIPLLVFVGLSIWKRSRRMMHIGLAVALCYLGWGYVKHEQVESFVREVAAERGHVVDRILLNPSIGNNILWRSVYQSGAQYYVDAVYAPTLSIPSLRAGVSVPAIDAETIFPELPTDSVQREDIRRFSYFSQGYIYIHPANPNVIGDLRYGTLPYDAWSFWGVKVTPSKPNTHAEFQNFRNITDDHYQKFWRMLQHGFKE